MGTDIWLSGVIGMLIGSYLGFITQGWILRPSIGDDYEIVKPKVKGQGNELRVEQTNIVRRILKRKDNKNGNKEN